jgi:hypothetical protein
MDPRVEKDGEPDMSAPRFDFMGMGSKDHRAVMVFRCHTCKQDLYCDGPERLPDEVAKHQIDSPSCFSDSHTAFVYDEREIK